MKWYKKILKEGDKKYMNRLVNQFMDRISGNDAIRIIIENDSKTEEYIRDEFKEKLEEYKSFVYNKIEDSQ